MITLGDRLLRNYLYETAIPWTMRRRPTSSRVSHMPANVMMSPRLTLLLFIIIARLEGVVLSALAAQFIFNGIRGAPLLAFGAEIVTAADR
jgi:hypothetical protein